MCLRDRTHDWLHDRPHLLLHYLLRDRRNVGGTAAQERDIISNGDPPPSIPWL
jgi:hypothetical protein